MSISRSTTLRLAAATAALFSPLATELAAQASYNQNLGTPLGMTDDSISANHALGFPFRFPDGTITTAIDIDSNGRVLLPGGDTSDLSETVAELLAQSSSICPFWVDLNPAASAADDVYFNALPGVALITWHDVVLFGGTARFTVQCQLHADNSIAFVYDSRVPTAADPIVGLSPGNGAADPGSTDLNANPVFTTTNPTLYEDLSNADVAGQGLRWTPLTPGWLVEVGDLASIENIGRACPRILDFTPAGAGYVTSPGNFVETDFGTSLGITGDDAIGGPFALGFSFRMPGGAIVTSIDVDTNCRILPPGGDATDWTPTVAEFLNEGHATIAPYWNDFNLNAIGGDISMRTSPGAATITWRNIAQFQQTRPMTVQCTLRADGSITIGLIDVVGYSRAAADNVIIGVSSGNGVADPGESNLSSASAVSTTSVLYEFFDVLVEEPDLQMRMRALNPPSMGSNFSSRIENLPPGTQQAVVLFGFFNPDIPLDLIGLPFCTLSVTSIGPAIPLTISGETSGTFTLPVSTDPVLRSLPVFLQGLAIIPGSGPLPFVLSDALAGIIGN